MTLIVLVKKYGKTFKHAEKETGIMKVKFGSDFSEVVFRVDYRMERLKADRQQKKHFNDNKFEVMRIFIG